MSAYPLVSVCIGVYNREKYIQEALDSVLDQTYQSIEVIVVDDASTDNTVEVIKSYGDAIRLIQRSENSGICPVTRNQAAKAANGKYIAFLDSDDAWLPDKIAAQVEFLEIHDDIPLCHTYCELIDENSNSLGIRHEGILPPTGNYFTSLLNHCMVTISSVMIRRTLFDMVGGYFIEDKEYGIWGEEYEFFLRVARSYKFGLIDQVLTHYRKGPDNISAGNWKCIPESVPFYKRLLSRKDIWEGIVPQRTIEDAYCSACLANFIFWFAKHSYLRSCLLVIWAIPYMQVRHLMAFLRVKNCN